MCVCEIYIERKREREEKTKNKMNKQTFIRTMLSITAMSKDNDP